MRKLIITVNHEIQNGTEGLTDNENNAVQIVTLIASYLAGAVESAGERELKEADFLREAKSAIKRQLYSVI